MQSVKNFLKEHFPPFIIFLIIGFGYFLPALTGKKLVQKDIVEAMCMQGEMKKYRDKGEHILWTNNMFSGMPTFQIRHYSGAAFINNILFWLNDLIDNPGFFLFVGMLGIYVFCLLLGISHWLAVIAAVGYALSSFNIIGILAGHTSKALSMALMAPMLAGIIYTFRKNMWAGALLTAFFTAFQIRTNHVQITYYAIIIAILLIVFELVRHIRQKELPKFIKASGLLLIGLLIGVMSNATLLLTTYDYSKQSMRGGATELSTKVEQQTKGGLSKDYAFSWSYGIMESLTFIIPGFSGGASLDKLGENSKSYKTLIARGAAANQVQKSLKQAPTYWGNQPYTAGPIYFGAVIVFLVLFSFLTIENKLKWWMLASILLAIFLAWGKNFSLLSYFFFDYVPMYNKFRTPSMMLSVVMFLAPVVAALGLQEIITRKIDKKILMRNLKISGGITLGLCAAIWLASGMFSYTASDPKIEIDKKYYENYKNTTKNEQLADEMLKALKADREMILKNDALRSFIFIALAVGLLFLFFQSKIKPQWMLAGMGLLIVIDLWAVDARYLNSDSYVDETEYKKNFMPRPVDDPILKDPELYFRVYDVTKDPFNNAMPSYYMKTIGGYHAAKLQRYQDVIEQHIRKGNMNVINMLNTKYYISLNESKQPILQQFPERMGNAWSVKNVVLVKNADEEIESLAKYDARTIAVADMRFANEIGSDTMFNNAGKIRLTQYHPEKLTYAYESSEPQFVVFSEIYYKGNEDWISYIDGKASPHIRVNYILRGMKVPAGNHEIVFEFKPKSFYTGETITLAANILMLLAAAGYGWTLYRKRS